MINLHYYAFNMIYSLNDIFPVCIFELFLPSAQNIIHKFQFPGSTRLSMHRIPWISSEFLWAPRCQPAVSISCLLMQFINGSGVKCWISCMWWLWSLTWVAGQCSKVIVPTCHRYFNPEWRLTTPDRGVTLFMGSAGGVIQVIYVPGWTKWWRFNSGFSEICDICIHSDKRLTEYDAFDYNEWFADDFWW